jgi:hypothetical protein
MVWVLELGSFNSGCPDWIGTWSLAVIYPPLAPPEGGGPDLGTGMKVGRSGDDLSTGFTLSLGGRGEITVVILIHLIPGRTRWECEMNPGCSR